MDKEIYVYADWFDGSPVLIGTLFTSVIRGNESFSFEYDPSWLKNNSSGIFFDVDILPYRGRQYLSGDKKIFGAFSDSCPDRWGRMLMQRREAVLAREENRKPNKLYESDYLLGVYDDSRMGGFRFSLDGKEFLSNDSNLSVPPWVNLRELEAASLNFESGEEKNEKKWLDQLIVPGSSLGGARPKASVIDNDGNLWIAKFPSKYDEYNVGAWEMVVHDLAEMCNLNVPEAKLESFTQNKGTFLSKRFDRNGNHRIHVASAMTMLGKTDMDKNSGYLDIAGVIRAHSINAEKDLIELWKRIVFNILVSNTDDHLRNHGFVLKKNGWTLSPMYDVNPTPYGNSLSLDIANGDSTIDLELALSTSRYYGIAQVEGKKIIQSMKNTVSTNWLKLSAKYKLSRRETEYMRPAFKEAD